MKKIQILLIILILVVPIIVLAETCDSNSVRIESIEVKSKNGTVQEETEATKNGNEININLNMIEVGDSITYQTKVKNYSDEDYYLDNSYLIVDNDYIEYSITSEDDSNIIAAQSSKNFDVKVKYRTKVADTSLTTGKYTDNNNLTIKMLTETNNPFTTDYIALYLAIFYISVFGLMYLFIKRKKVEETVIVLLVALLIPLSVNALCKSELVINSKVNILRGELATFSIACSPVTYQYYKGMTFGEWIKSDLYSDNINGDFESLQRCEKVFGTNKGCALNYTIEKYLYYDNYDNYYLDRNECYYPDECEEITNEVYEGGYTNKVYSSKEYCESINGVGNCLKHNELYVYLSKKLFPSEDSCNTFMNENIFAYKSCTPVYKAYKETIENYRTFDTLEDCNREKPAGSTCSFETINYYSPTRRENGDGRGSFTFFYHFITYNNSYSDVLLPYKDVIDNTEPYSCTEDN